METPNAATKRVRTKPERSITIDDVKVVYDEYHDKTALQLSDERGLAKSQITTIITNLRKAGMTPKKKSGKQIIEEFVLSVGKKNTKKR